MLAVDADGLPVLQFGDFNFTTPDSFVKIDATLDHLEVVRGGSASTLATNSPGGIINFISKNGKEKGGSVSLSRGVGYDQTPTNDAHRDVRVPDTTRTWLSFGLGWTPSEKTEVNVGYTHLLTNDPSVNNLSATGSTLSGKYDVNGDVLGASINYKF